MVATRTISWSEIDSFRQCPLKHQLQYKQRWVPAKPSEALSRGTLAHQVWAVHYDGLMAGRVAGLSDAEISQHIVTEVNQLLFDPTSGHQTEEQALVEWLYLGYLARYGTDNDWKILAVEHEAVMWLPTETGHRSSYRIKMIIDLIVRWNGRIWLVDHKTCKDLPKEKEMALDDQFGLYAWGLRKLGKTVHGCIYNAARTLRYKDPNKVQPLDERFSRYALYRTDVELDTIAVEAYRTARRAYAADAGPPERNPNTDTCRWRCDFLEPCLAGRKGVDIDGFLVAKGFTQDHR